MKIFLVYILFINLVGFLLMGMDKKKAVRRQYRISEAVLWMISILGGAIGTTVGMNVYRHKTKHLNFKLGLPLLAIIQICGMLYIM